MKNDNPLDAALEAKKDMPESVRTAVTHTADVLEMAWLTAKSVFEDKAQPEHALALLPTLLERADAARQERLDEARARMSGGTR